MNRPESSFQSSIVKKIKSIFPGCMVFKNDPTSTGIQGVPDLLILYKNKWASLECKRSSKSKKQPNQEFYVNKMNEMSFSRFIYPENEKETLNDLQQALQSRG